jgi:integrase
MPALPKGVDLLPSGGFRARLTYKGVRYTDTFDTPRAAAAWIQRTRSELVAGTYIDPLTQLPPGIAQKPTFATYAAAWVEARDIKPRTRSEYHAMLSQFGSLDPLPLDRISRDMVRQWFESLTVGATRKRHLYELLRAILNSAVDDEHIDINPARIKGATKTPRRTLPDLPTAAQVQALAEKMPAGKYRTMTLLTAWTGLRFGEATELRRKDILLSDDDSPLAVRIRRAVTRAEGEYIVSTPKSAAGVRDVVIPPHIRSAVADYLDSLPANPNRLLFPGSRTGQHMTPQSLYKPFYRAREAVGLPSLRWHDLRHFSATEAARTGATLAELQARLGHSTVQASMTYQWATSGRDAAIAEAMSAAAMTQSDTPA